jgi:hypothetical protein
MFTQHTRGESSVRVNKEPKAEGNWEVTGSGASGNLFAVKHPQAGQYGAMNCNLCPAQHRISQKGSDHSENPPQGFQVLPQSHVDFVLYPG